MTKSIILIEHNTNLNLLKNLDHSKSKIISLDIVAHKNLLDAHIQHELVENYFEPSDENYIDELIIDKSTNWYKDEEISKLLIFENINLGWLLEIEIFSYLAQIIKKFVGITRLFEKECFEEVYCSNLLSLMLQNISKNVKINELSTTSEIDFHFENIEIPLSVGGKLIPIRISRKLALKVKKFVEFLTNILLNSKISLDKNKIKDRILLLDFDIVLYENLISTLSKNFEIILLNERKPSIWNLESFKIFKKLNSKIIQLKDLKDSQINLKIENESELLNKKLSELFKCESYFQNFFSAYDKSFWSAIKTNFISICNARFKESIQRYILSQKLFEVLDIDKIIVIYNTGFEEKMILFADEKQKVSGLILQHGYLRNPSYLKKYLSISPIMPNPRFKNGLWGNNTYELFLKLGIPEENLITVGSPRHDHFFNSKKSLPKNIIIFFDSIPNELDFKSFDTNQLIKNENTIKKICEKLNSLPSHDLIVKLHPGQHVLPYSIKPLIKKIDKNIPIYQSKNIFKFFIKCDLIVISELSTVILEAMILGIPTITYISDNSSDEEEIFKSGASILVHSYDDFQIQLNKILNDSKIRNDLISKGKKFTKKYFSFQGESCNSFLNTL